MNKYYLIIVQNDSVVAIYSYDSMDSVLAAYHNELAYRSELRTSTDCAILNEALQVMMKESYRATVSESTPEPSKEETEPGEGE